MDQAGAPTLAAEPQSAQRAPPLPAILLARQAAAGNFAPEVRRWLECAFAAWLRAHGALPLPRCLHLPASAARLRTAQRDYFLAQYVDALAIAGTPWQVAKRVRDDVSYFANRRWPLWRSLPAAPAHATLGEQILFDAFAAGAEMPTTAKGIARIFS